MLALLSMSVLLVSYREAQISAGEMRTRGAPAVQGVAATQLALLRAHQEAQFSVRHDIDGVVGAARATRASSPPPPRASPGSTTYSWTGTAAAECWKPSTVC